MKTALVIGCSIFCIVGLLGWALLAGTVREDEPDDEKAESGLLTEDD